MPSTAQKNQFRRLVGDFGDSSPIDDAMIDSYLDDATFELTSDFVNTSGVSAPVSDFDSLVPQYQPEVIYYAAIQFWWNKLSKLADMHTKSVGSATSNVSERWDRVLQMIEKLEARYSEIQTLGTDITIGNLSRFSKQTLMRQGGRREEDVIDEYYGS